MNALIFVSFFLPPAAVGGLPYQRFADDVNIIASMF